MLKKQGNYIIDGGQAGKSRLNVLAEVLYPYTRALLEAEGLLPGMHLLDVGCGGGNVAMMTASIVGPKGSVTAIDFDSEIIALDQQDAMATGTNNIDFHAVSAYDIDYNNEFDIVYSRFLLSHLQDPIKVLKKMVQSVQPGGKIIVEDIHFSGHFCYPACNAFDDYVAYFTEAARNNGHDAEIGARLPGLFKAAGIENIRFDVIQPTFNTGKGKWMAYLTLDKIKNTLMEQGIATEESIAKMLLELERFTNDDSTIISLPRIFRVWGTKISKTID
ncbi:MAG: methyltransferase domain-containing protein [Flavipsychrobacter sp.]|nr:methyltransferase domain-containing protein [Flavipsychrobacter sp.]